MKNNGSGCYQIRQTGIDNYLVIKAICLKVVGREASPIKADSQNSYQLSLGSKIDVQKVIEFFSSPTIHPLIGYKQTQYQL